VVPRSDAAYDTLRSRIVSGDYPPGSHLPEEAISEELGVSRTPIRAALRRLHEDGLVTLSPRRGAFVAEYTRADIDEVFDLRGLLEARAARLASTLRTPDQLARLEELVEEMEVLSHREDRAQRDALLRNNREFHELVLTAARSPRQYRIATTLAQSSVTVGTFFYYSPADIRRSLQFHRDITWAISQGLGEIAGSLMSTHLAIAHTAFVTQRFGARTARNDDMPSSSATYTGDQHASLTVNNGRKLVTNDARILNN
jgi:DNA-binding GntR family transcriptional regulator